MFFHPSFLLLPQFLDPHLPSPLSTPVTLSSPSPPPDVVLKLLVSNPTRRSFSFILGPRVAEVGSLSAGAKMALKVFVRRLFAIFATNASFLRVITNLQI